MADVALDDLIKKDKEKGKLDRLKNVPSISFRNSKPRNLSIGVDLMIIKTEVIEGLKMLLITKTDQSKSILITLVMIVEITGKDIISEIKEMIDPDLKLNKKKKDKNSSEL